jgi:ribonuclease P/MRP protein subunit RPP40
MTPQAPTKVKAQPIINRDMTVAIPPLKPEIEVASPMQREDYEEYATDVYEWLSMARLESPRILSGDHIDPYLSRYQVPGNNIEQLPPTKICKITWEGFFGSDWARRILVDVMLALPSKAWFSLSATTVSTGLVAQNTDCTFLRLPNSPGEYFMWEVKGHE